MKLRKAEAAGVLAALAFGLAGCQQGGHSADAQGSGGTQANGATAAATQGDPPAPAPQLPPGQIKAATDTVTRPFYQARAFQAAWSDQAANQLNQAIGARAQHGLDKVDFGKDVAAAQGPAARDVALTRTALAYASALAHGEADPNQIRKVYTIPRPDPDLAQGLSQALAQGHVRQWLESLAPQDQDYRLLSQAYLQARRAVSSGGVDDKSIADTGAIHVGDTDKRMPAIRQRLAEDGYLRAQAAGGATPAGADRASGKTGGAAQPAGGDRYTPDLARAVKQLQSDFGLKVDGVIGGDTFEALNITPADRVGMLAVALERLRWLPRNPPATRIDVNIAAAELSYYRGGKLVDRRKVVVGEPGKETPQLQAHLYRLVANPTWTVPKDIAADEMAGKGPAYFKQHNMIHKGGFVVQQSGPDNSLGLVKFDLDDTHAIYLHDTNAKQLFQEAERYLSHGCVRVDNALQFAKGLAQQEGIVQQWQQARGTGQETFVKLPQPITVWLFYHDVFVRDGKPVFRADPYGWDDDVAQKLGFGGQAGKAAQVKAADLGP